MSKDKDREKLTYRQFKDWCNERCCDGKWSAMHALIAIKLIDIMENQTFWKKNSEWENNWKQYAMQLISSVENANTELKECGENKENES